jgi:hypothetical protein
VGGCVAFVVVRLAWRASTGMRATRSRVFARIRACSSPQVVKHFSARRQQFEALLASSPLRLCLVDRVEHPERDHEARG